MSLAKVPSKVKDAQEERNGPFALASMIFHEIESLLETELAEYPQLIANYEHNTRAKSKRKRGPYLIKPLNKNKTRKTVSGMQFDPDRLEWTGNEEAMSSFAGHQPALIANKGRHEKPITVGKMVWDPATGSWRGNEKDRNIFEKPKRPGLIRNRIVASKELTKDDMKYNPITGKWEGNDTVLDGFPPDEDCFDEGFTVGSEFQLSAALTQLFMDCAAKHKAAISGWWQDEKSRTHLHAIRTMSIARMVRDVRRVAYADYDEPSPMDIAETPAPIKPEIEAEDLDDAYEDLFPPNGTIRIKMPKVDSPANIDIDLDMDDQELSKEQKKSNRSSIKRVVVEDWDDEFNDLDISKISQKTTGNAGTVGTVGMPAHGITGALTHGSGTITHLGGGSGTITQLGGGSGTITQMGSGHGTITHLGGGNGTITQLGNGAANAEKWAIDKKPFALLKSDAPNRRSFIFPGGSIKKAKETEEDDELGFDIPAEPLKLKVNGHHAAHDDDAFVVDLDGEAESDHEQPEPEEHEQPDHYEETFDDVEEEDWNDVEVPSSLGEPITKRPIALQPPPEKEVWDDFDIPTEKLALKLSQQKMKPTSRKNKNKEDWDDVEIPDNLALRLKRK